LFFISDIFVGVVWKTKNEYSNYPKIKVTNLERNFAKRGQTVKHVYYIKFKFELAYTTFLYPRKQLRCAKTRAGAGAGI
jgi:hypothetical protein